MRFSSTLVFRYNDSFAPPGGTIEAHLSLLRARGYVWYGKMGRAVGALHLARLRDEISRNGSAVLILAGPKDLGGQFFLCEVRDVRSSLPADESDSVPEYYRNRIPDCVVWFRLDSIIELDKKQAGSLIVLSSGKPLVKALSSSSTSFVVSSAGAAD